MQILDITNFKAAIFDMDGTMIDNMATHKEAWHLFCAKLNIELTDDDFKKKIAGLKNSQIQINLFGNQLTPDQVENNAAEKEALYRKLYEDKIKEVSGLTKLLTRLKDLNKRLAIATTAPRLNREFALSKLKLENIFELIVGDEDVTNGKPDPEIYLKTAKLLGVSPSDCLVFEDSPAGVRSAKEAGMFTVGILTTYTEDNLKQADLTINNFEELLVK